MQNGSVGKLRGIQQVSSSHSTFTASVLDHRQNLHKVNPALASDEQLSRFKLDVTSTLALRTTADLLGLEVFAAQTIAIPNNVGLIATIESTGYSGEAPFDWCKMHGS